MGAVANKQIGVSKRNRQPCHFCIFILTIRGFSSLRSAPPLHFNHLLFLFLFLFLLFVLLIPQDAAEVCRRLMAVDPEEVHFTLMALTAAV